MTDSIRKQILTNMVAAFAQVTPANGWPIEFSTCVLGPLGEQDQRKRYSIGVVAGKERFKHQFSYYDCFLPVAVEFRITVNRGDAASAELVEQVLTIVEQVALANTTWGGLAIDTILTSNEVDLTTYADRSAEGVLFFEVHYRHSRKDPTDANPSF